MRQRLAWFTTAPLMLGGLLAGHALGYRLAIGDPHARADALAHSGHGYFGYAPFALAVCLGVLGVALVLQGVTGFRGERRRPATSPLILLLPPLAFVVQEFLERSSMRATSRGRRRSSLRSSSGSHSSSRSRWPLFCSPGRWTRPRTRSGKRWPLRPGQPSRPLSPFPSASSRLRAPPASRAATENAHRPSLADRSFRWPRSRGLERRSGLKRSTIALAVVLIALAAAPSAFAHAILQESTPSNDMVVRQSPPTVTLRFNEAVETAFGSIRAYNCAGGRVDSGKISRPDERKVSIGLDRQTPSRDLHRHVEGDLGRCAPGRGRLRLPRPGGGSLRLLHTGVRQGHSRRDQRALQVRAGSRLRAGPARRRRRCGARARPALGGRRVACPPLPDPRRARGRRRICRDPLHRAPGGGRRRIRPVRGVPLEHGRLGAPDALRQGVPLPVGLRGGRRTGGVHRRTGPKRGARGVDARSGALPAADALDSGSCPNERIGRAR